MINLESVQFAAEAIKPYVKSTPLKRSQFLSGFCGGDVFLKLENLQVTGAFKVRGAFNKMLHLQAEKRRRGVVTASAGNHGLAIAYAAKKLEIPATVVLPTSTPKNKTDGIKRYGANVVLFGDIYDDAERRAREMTRENGLAFVSPYNDELVAAGNGTVALEILTALSNVEVVVVPVGGGGLISGMSIALKTISPKLRVYGVQSETSPVMHDSLKAGSIVEFTKSRMDSLAEGLFGGVERDSITFKVIQQWVDEVLVIKEETIKRAIYLLWEKEKQVAEGSGAAAIAPMLENPDLFAGKTVAAVITGGNIDAEVFKGIISPSR
ncbi:MAG: threonine/serine dehydratase [Candidatus Bathyarchaeia archaeon]